MKHFLYTLGFWLLLTVGVAATPLFAVCTTTCTWTAASTLMWSTSSGGATGAGPPGSGDTVTFDGSTCVGGVTCTITLNIGGPITIQSLTIGACTASTTGCIFDNSVNNNNITVTNSGNAFSITGSGTRNIKLGTATYTITNNGGSFTAANVTNLTLSAASSIITYTGTGTRNFSYGSGTVTFGTVNVGAAVSSGNPFTFIGTSATTTITAVNITGPNYVFFPNSTTTITTLNCNGTSSAQSVLQGANITQATITTTAGSIGQWCGLWGIVFTNAATLSNGFNFGSNSNVTVTAPGGGGGGCIINGWLLWKDFDRARLNDNFPMWLEEAA